MGAGGASTGSGGGVGPAGRKTSGAYGTAKDARRASSRNQGRKAAREWQKANDEIQTSYNYWRYGNSALTDPITGKPCGKGYEKYE